jgi:perosamine synthetase
MPSFLERKRALAARYRDAFADVGGVTVVEEPRFARSNYWLNALLLDEAVAKERDALLERAHDAGIGARPAWTLMPKLPMYEDCPRMDLSVAEYLQRRLVNVPSTPSLVSEGG